MKTIRVLATKPKNHPFPIISWAIRLMEWSPQSHISFAFFDEDVVRHSRFNDIEEVPFQQFLDENSIICFKDIALSEVQYFELDEHTQSRLGKQTGYFLTLFGSIIPLLLRHIGINMKNYLYKGTTCSEFFREEMEVVNRNVVYKFSKDIPKGNFTTDDALHLASQSFIL